MRLLSVVLLLAMPVAALADQPAIQLDHVWARAAMAAHTGVVYLTVTDKGPADTLTGASTPVAAQAELHETLNDNGVMKMRAVASLPVTPGKPLTFAPGGYHIMLMDLKQPLKEGDSFPVTLSFAKAGQVTAMVTVEKAGAAAMPGMDHGGIGGVPMPSGKQP